MSNYYEIDFLDVESKKSGDAITIRYELDGETYIHVVDGGFQATGEKVTKHIDKYYGDPKYIDHVVATHPDGDHAGGLRTVLEEFEIGTLWMARPWLYADDLLPRFKRFTSAEGLNTRLKEIYPNIAALEEIAHARGIDIREPFTGTHIGAFTVLSPSYMHYLDMVVESDKTPESHKAEEANSTSNVLAALYKAANVIRSLWGEEIFSTEETSSENEMSVVQYGEFCEEKVLLTGDAGRTSLSNAADYLEGAGVALPCIDKFQVPHHGSRRNVSTEILDRWLGEKHGNQTDETSFSAIVSASKEDDDHPRKSVLRGFIHRGAVVVKTEGENLRVGKDAPERAGWVPATPYDYPEDQEE